MLYYVVRGFFWVLLRGLLAIFGGLQAEGTQNIPRQGPLIVAPNHPSLSDPVVIGLTLKRPAYFMANDEIFRIPILGPLAKFLRAYPVKQDSPDRSALHFTEELLKRGEAVVIFPEGHVSPDGTLKPIQPGLVMVARRTGAPVLPVGLIGTERLVPYGKFIPRPAGQRIRVRYGQPICVEELTGGLKAREGLEHGVALLQKKLLELTQERPVSQDNLLCSHAKDTPLHPEGLAEYSNSKEP
jgi:1-acyl-sn-glycerol-3-phosphate acyltransferase